jgi:hypothetical protein
MAEPNNVDGVLTQVLSEQLEEAGAQLPAVDMKNVTESVPKEYVSSEKIENNVENDTKTNEVDVPSETINENVTKQEVDNDSPIDEYGNPIAKPKMYSQEEVNRMIRERLSRGKYSQEQERQVQKSTHNYQQQANNYESGEEDWQHQLDNFIDQKLERRERESHERAWREQEMKRQSDFEDKFTSGMERYSDFRDVVGGRPISDNMMLSIRGLDNPAAFIYGASKLHPKEIDRISQIVDPYQQASEMGRLHERMVKERRVAVNATKPLETPKSDISSKVNNRPSIESLIDQHAKQKIARR